MLGARAAAWHLLGLVRATGGAACALPARFPFGLALCVGEAQGADHLAGVAGGFGDLYLGDACGVRGDDCLGEFWAECVEVCAEFFVPAAKCCEL